MRSGCIGLTVGSRDNTISHVPDLTGVSAGGDNITGQVFFSRSEIRQRRVKPSPARPITAQWVVSPANRRRDDVMSKYSAAALINIMTHARRDQYNLNSVVTQVYLSTIILKKLRFDCVVVLGSSIQADTLILEIHRFGFIS